MYVCVWAHIGKFTRTSMHAAACGHLRLITGIILDYSSNIFNEARSHSHLALGILPPPLEARITGRPTHSVSIYMGFGNPNYASMLIQVL